MTTTPNYNFELSDVGGDRNTWGGKLNGNWTAIDTALKATDDQVAQNVAAIQANTDAIAQIMLAMNPVGTIVYNKTGDNPSTYLGGTWVPYAVNHAIRGADTGDTGGDTVGSDTHTLVQDEMPAHAHGVTDPGHQHSLDKEVWSKQGDLNKQFSAGSLQLDFSPNAIAGTTATGISIQPTGGGSAHNNIQASMKTFAWERTA